MDKLEKKLIDASENELVMVTSVDVDAEQKTHLANLGLVSGRLIKVISKQSRQMIIHVQNTRVGLDEELQKAITVTNELKNMGKVATLDQVAIGSEVIVEKLQSTGALKRKLMDMGITKNAKISVRKVAPLGDPIELTVRGYELTLRKNEAHEVLVRDFGKE